MKELSELEINISSCRSCPFVIFNDIKKLLIKWLCKPCKEVTCIEDLSRVYFGSVPSIGNPLFYLRRDEQQNDEYKMLEDGIYTHKGKKLVIENESVKIYE